MAGPGFLIMDDTNIFLGTDVMLSIEHQCSEDTFNHFDIGIFQEVNKQVFVTTYSNTRVPVQSVLRAVLCNLWKR